jgi:tetratricopeptide (TPR) repeat protein
MTPPPATEVEARPPASPAATAPARPGPAAPRRRRPRARTLAAGALLLGLLGLTFANVTWSDALPEARAYYDRTLYPQALRRALDHLDRRPWSREAHRLAALSLSRMEFGAQAERHYRRAGPLDRRDAHVRAFGLVRSRQADAAVAAYEAILARVPDEPEALRRLAVVEMTRGQFSRSIALANRLAAIPGHEVVGWTMVGAFNHNAKDYELSLPAFEEVLRRDPALARMPLPRREFWTYVGHDLLARGQAERARVLMARAHDELGDDPQILYYLGGAHYLAGNLEAAEPYLRRVVALDPMHAEAWSTLGRLELTRNRPEAAVGALERALALSPRSYDVLYSLVLATTRLGRDADAARHRAALEALKARQGTPATGMDGPGRMAAPTPGGNAAP